MNIAKFTQSMAILLAGILMATSSASAATTVYNADDLMLGFRQEGNNLSYVLDIGQVFQYRTATNPLVLNTSAVTANSTGAITGIGSAANIYADIASVFGAGWESDASIHWGVVGTPGSSDKVPADATLTDPGNTLYASSTSLTPNATYDRNLSAGQSGVKTAILAMANSAAAGSSYRGATVGAGSILSPVGVKELSGYAQNYEKFVNGTSTQSLTGAFNYFTGGTLEGTPANSSLLNLFRIQPSDAAVAGGQNTTTAGTDLGQLVGAFTINTTGTGVTGATTITWNAAAVPEPSRALLLVGGIASLIMRRRRPAASI